MIRRRLGFNYIMRTASSLRPGQDDGGSLRGSSAGETDEMTLTDPSATFVECAGVNLFNTTICLPPEGG